MPQRETGGHATVRAAAGRSAATGTAVATYVYAGLQPRRRTYTMGGEGGSGHFGGGVQR